MDKLNINLAGMVVHESMWAMLRKFWMAVFIIILYSYVLGNDKS